MPVYGPVPVLESTAATVKLNGPTLVGVPAITPAALNVTPPGRAPDCSDQPYGAVPPVAVSAIGP